MTTKEHTYGVADALIWLGVAAVTVWALGKAIGWIFSPIWVDMVPIFGGVATVAGISIKVGQRCCRNRMLSSVMPEGVECEVKAIDRRRTVLEASRAET